MKELKEIESPIIVARYLSIVKGGDLHFAQAWSELNGFGLFFCSKEQFNKFIERIDEYVMEVENVSAIVDFNVNKYVVSYNTKSYKWVFCCSVLA
jgi:hypothetical protein